MTTIPLVLKNIVDCINNSFESIIELFSWKYDIIINKKILPHNSSLFSNQITFIVTNPLISKQNNCLEYRSFSNSNNEFQNINNNSYNNTTKVSFDKFFQKAKMKLLCFNEILEVCLSDDSCLDLEELGEKIINILMKDIQIPEIIKFSNNIAKLNDYLEELCEYDIRIYTNLLEMVSLVNCIENENMLNCLNEMILWRGSEIGTSVLMDYCISGKKCSELRYFINNLGYDFVHKFNTNEVVLILVKSKPELIIELSHLITVLRLLHKIFNLSKINKQVKILDSIVYESYGKYINNKKPTIEKDIRYITEKYLDYFPSLLSIMDNQFRKENICGEVNEVRNIISLLYSKNH